MHVVKTGGTLLSTFLMYNVYDKLKNIDVEIKRETLTNPHVGWKLVADNQYVISSFRDPVKRIISHFFHLLRSPPTDDVSIVTRENKWRCFIGGNISNYTNPTKNDFFSWLEYSNPHINNYQSKNFFYKEDIETIPFSLRGITAPLYLEGFNEADVLKNISRINLLLKTEDISINNFENLLSRILNDFNLKNKDKLNTDILSYNLHKKSFEFYNSLSKKEIEYIESLNTLDLEIYNTESFFWDPKTII